MRISIYNDSGSVDVIVDVQGWFPTGPAYTAVPPARVLETRTGLTTVDGEASGGRALAAGTTIDVDIAGRGGVPPTGVSAVVLNVTATDQTENTFLTVFPAGTTRPGTSNLNPSPGLTAPNLVIADVGANGAISIYNDAGSVDVIVDISGWLPNDIVASDDTFSLTEDAAATIMDVVSNDIDHDGGSLTIASVTQPAGGTVQMTGGAVGAWTGLTYTPHANYCNTSSGATPDTFTYTLNGGFTATAAVTVSCVDDAPRALADTATVVEDGSAAAIAVLANDTDVDGGTKIVSSVTQPSHGIVSITGGGTGISYSPSANYCNTPPGSALDTFTYTLNGGSAAAVGIAVTCVDDAPVAVADAATVVEDAAATAVDVLTDDTDVDGGLKAIASATDPTHGTVVLTGGLAGSRTGLTYQPDANYCNNPPGTSPDTFTYTLMPGGSSATVSMLVTCVEEAPVVTASSWDDGVHRGGAAHRGRHRVDRLRRRRHDHRVRSGVDLQWLRGRRCVVGGRPTRHQRHLRRRHRRAVADRRQLRRQLPNSAAYGAVLEHRPQPAVDEVGRLPRSTTATRTQPQGPAPR